MAKNLKISTDMTLLDLGGMESNIYLVGEALLIDTGTGSQRENLSCALDQAGVSFDDIRQVVLTHAHFDHIGGAQFFRKAKIAVHSADAKVVEGGDMKASAADLLSIPMSPRKVDIRLEDGDEITSDGVTFKVIHTPGHTKGSICLFNESDGTLFSGDTVFADGFGRVDLPGGDMDEMVESLTRLSKFRVEKLLPGHGEVVMESGYDAIRNILKNISAYG